MNFERSIPILRMFDVAKAREFYIDYLGFDVLFEHRFEENAPLYMAVVRGNIEIHLSEHYGDGTPGSNVMFDMIGVDDYLAELQAKDYKYYRPSITDQDWGRRDIMLRDPFSNKITFSEVVDS